MDTPRRLIPIDDVVAKTVRWLWPGRMPLGAVTIMEGDPGHGKSSVALDIAARVTRGKPMPNAQRGMQPAGVVILQAEDNIAATVKPTLLAAAADMKRVYVYDRAKSRDRPLVLPDDLVEVEVAAAEVNALLVIIDPLLAFVGHNSASDRYVRHLMGTLTSLAERLDLAVLGIRHLTKSGSGNPLYRGYGGIGLVAAARSVLVAGSDPDHDDSYRHVLAQTKTNLSNAVSLAYQTTKKGDSILVEWLGQSQRTALDLVGKGNNEQSRLMEAAYVLYSILTHGPVPAMDVVRLAFRAAVAKRTLDRAKELMRVRSWKDGSGTGSRWYWELPDDETLIRQFKDRDLDELTYRLLHGGDDPPLPGDGWKYGHDDDDPLVGA